MTQTGCAQQENRSEQSQIAQTGPASTLDTATAEPGATPWVKPAQALAAAAALTSACDCRPEPECGQQRPDGESRHEDAEQRALLRELALRALL
jgi:hypothetical protein